MAIFLLDCCVTIDIAHVISDTRPSRFSACNIEKMGRAWGQGYIEPKKKKIKTSMLITIGHYRIPLHKKLYADPLANETTLDQHVINSNSGHVHTCQHDTLDDEILIVSQNGSLSNTSLKFTYLYNDIRGLLFL